MSSSQTDNRALKAPNPDITVTKHESGPTNGHFHSEDEADEAGDHLKPLKGPHLEEEEIGARHRNVDDNLMRSLHALARNVSARRKQGGRLASSTRAAFRKEFQVDPKPRPRAYSMSAMAKNAIFSSEREPILRTTNQKTIYTQGRPPWYDAQGQGQLKEALVIGICGGSASGKTTVAQSIIEKLDIPWVTLLSMDSYYKVLNEEQQALAAKNDYNFDHPDAFDFDLLIETLQRLKEGKKVEVPIYNFVSHSREDKTVSMYGANVIIFEGILAFHHPKVLELLDMKIFVDTDSDLRLCRRLKRDISQRGRDLQGVLDQYRRFVKPAFDHYIAPTMIHGDLIVPKGGENMVAINLIVRHAKSQLESRCGRHRDKLAHNFLDDHQALPGSLHVLPSTTQIRGMLTFIRNRETSRDDFIFYSKRLIRLVIEYSLSLLPFKEVTVETPQEQKYVGKMSNERNICGVSIMRAGEAMEEGLMEVCQDIRIGKILIQTSPENGEPELFYLRLPKDIKDYQVILMDATVASGAAAMMAIRVLLDHEVPEENIHFVSLVMATTGVHNLAYAFPKVKIIAVAVDPKINENFYVIPGLGNFGDRYFGTEPEPWLTF